MPSARRAAPPCSSRPRRSATADDFDVLPQHAARMAGAERFHRRFFRRESSSQMRSGVPPLGTIGNLAGGEHALQEAIAVTFEHLCKAGNVGGVEPDAEYVHDRSTAYPRLRVDASALGHRAALRAARRPPPITSSPANNLTLRDDPASGRASPREIGVAREDLLLVSQVHEATVAVASADRPRPWPRPDADAIVSNDPGAAIGDPGRRLRAGAARGRDAAGPSRRFMPAGAARRARAASPASARCRQPTACGPNESSRPSGPAIGPCCYEVSESTYQTFRDAGPSRIDS